MSLALDVERVRSNEMLDRTRCGLPKPPALLATDIPGRRPAAAMLTEELFLTEAEAQDAPSKAAAQHC
jgi:hypothetical protein